MCLTINNANAFGVKDEIVNMIELSDGNFINGAVGNYSLSTEVVRTITETSYRTVGTCDDGYYGFARTGEYIGQGGNSNGSAVCVKCVPVTSAIDNYLTGILGADVATGDFDAGYYYQIMVFYQLDLPVVSQVYDFKTKGETKILYGDPAGICAL